MFYIYCPRASEGAVELAKTLGGKRFRTFDGLHFWKRGKRVDIEKGSTVVCWGADFPEVEGVHVLNGGAIQPKYTQAHLLSLQNIPTVVTAQLSFQGGIPRSNHHSGGNDLLNGVAKPDFWVQKEEFVKEFRVHIFDDKSIRAGVKVPRIVCPRVLARVTCPECNYPGGLVFDGPVNPPLPHATHHPWVRSSDGGWRVEYDGFKSSRELRALAKAAVKALGLSFGAVDVGETAEGTLMVLEVNRAPGIENNSVVAYADAILRWADKLEVEGEI